MKYKHLIIPLVILLSVSGFIYLKTSQNSSNMPQTTKQKVERSTLVSSISASGQFLLANQFTLTTPSTGLVKNLYIKEGDLVKTGQKIAEIQLDTTSQQKSTSAYSAYLSAKSALVTAETNFYTLQSSLFAANQKFINDSVARDLALDDPTYIQQNAEWLAAESKYKNQAQVVAEAKINLQSAWLNYQSQSSIITAPVSGKVTSITIVPGLSLSSTSNKVAVISTPGLPLASFNVTELDVPTIKPGQKATIKVDSLNNKTFTGKVVAVDRVGTTNSNVTSYPVIIQLDVEAEDILPNMSATANIILQIKENVLNIPTSAISNSSVKVLKDGREITVPIETGITSDSQTEITSGLSEGDELIISTPNSNTTRSSSSGGSIFGGSGFRVGGSGAGMAVPR